MNKENILLARFRERISKRMASSHIAGPSLNDALEIYQRVTDQGWLCTLSPWNDPAAEPACALSRYVQTVSAIADRPDMHLSVKIPDLGFDERMLDILLADASGHNLFIQIDSLGIEFADRTLTLVEHRREKYPHIGCTLPSRWKRSLADAERMIDMKIPVRVIKGQWRDPSDPDRHCRRSFLDLVDRLAGRAERVAIATHDRLLAKESLLRLTRAGTAAELEQMIGLPSIAHHTAIPLGVPTRMYIPFGHPYVPYNISDIWKRPVLARWLLRDLALGDSKKWHRTS